MGDLRRRDSWLGEKSDLGSSGTSENRCLDVEVTFRRMEFADEIRKKKKKKNVCRVRVAKVSPLVCTLSYPRGGHYYRTHVAPLTSSQIAIFGIGVDSAPSQIDKWPFPLSSLELCCISKVNFKQTFEVFFFF